MLGVMVTLHELGHFLTARAFGIHVQEFAIGMGPALYKRTSKKLDEEGNPMGATFSLRAFPIGGFCDMGEDEDSDESTHFRNKPLWQRCIVLAGGSVMNLLLGIAVVFIMLSLTLGRGIYSNEITGVMEDCPYINQIQAGDRVIEVDGHKVHDQQEVLMFMTRAAERPFDMVLLRGSEKIKLQGLELQLRDGDKRLLGIYMGGVDWVTWPYVFKATWRTTLSNVRLVWMGLADLVTGRAKMTEMMGPVGMGAVVNDVVSDAAAADAPPSERALLMAVSLLQLMALITVNLAVFNMLPIPALDGGRILLALFSALLVKIRKRPLSSKIEGALHGGVMLLLFGLMIFVFFNDIRRLIGF